MKRILTLWVVALVASTSLLAQRVTDRVDRGLVVVNSRSGGNFVSWRIFAEEYYDVTYNLYRDDKKIASNLSISNYNDTNGTTSSKYQVAAVVRGVEQEKCAVAKRWSALDTTQNPAYSYLRVAVPSALGRDGTNQSSHYSLNDMCLADVTGDGQVEFITKRVSDNAHDTTNKNTYHHIEVYDITGKRLWWIDLGPNMLSGADEQFDAVAYDWDGDGKAEVLLRGADNMIIHRADGSTKTVGSSTVDTRWNGIEFTSTGNEYLLYLNGETGVEYQIIDYPLPRGNDSDWGTGIVGHRSTKHYFGAPFLDGRHASIFLGRGCYTKHHFKAFDVNSATHQLVQRWEWRGESWPWFGQGYHNYGIADVDWDGRDEIVFGSMVIDDNGKGLHTTGLGHGDAQHCSDLDPYRHGQELFACNEDSPAMNYRDATTGKIYYRLQSTGDDGRALCGNFTNSYPGSIGRSTQSGIISTVADKVLNDANVDIAWNDLNFRIYWDSDLCEEVLNSPGTMRDGIIFGPGKGRVFQSGGCALNNSSKNNPCATGDILGDWREELIMREGDNSAFRIYTTNWPMKYRNYTLWHDHQYRQGMVWECMGYNQPPHTSYFLGEMENITVAPPPLTMTGRTEISNNGSISTANAGQHVIVCETNDTRITVADGANPYVATFNVPSWVQGTNSTKTDGTGLINHKYYQCTVTGGGFAGDMRLVKQGDGTLTLPAVEQKYTGNTDVWAGVLNFDGKLLQSTLWLNRFAELNSNGGQFRCIKADYAAKVRPGGQDTKGTMTTDTLSLGFGSRVVFDIYGDLTADQFNVTKYLSIESKASQTVWVNYGPQYLTPVFEFVNHHTELLSGRYLLGTVGTVKGNISNIKLEGLDRKKQTHLVLEDGKLYLEVADVRGPATIVWTGAQSAVWNFAQDYNFLVEGTEPDASGNGDIFVNGDKVIFDDTAKKFNVTIGSDVQADSVIVNSSKNYTFTGTGSISGNSVLVKRGTGVLTVSNENSYTGGTLISGGTLRVASLANDFLEKGNLGVVTTLANKFVIENDATLNTTASVTQGSPMLIRTGGGNINNTGDFVVAKPISGSKTRLTKKGTGWMKLNVANPQLDTLAIAAGTVQCVNCNVPAKVVEFQNGTLSENVGTSYAIHVPAKKAGTWNLVNNATYTNRVTGEGTLSISCPTVEGGSGDGKWYATRTQVAFNLSAFAGTIKPVKSNDPDGRFTMNTGTSAPKATFQLDEGIQLMNTGKSFRMAKVTGKGSLSSGCVFSNGATVGANTWLVGDDSNFSFAGKVTGTGTAFTKMGTGQMTVSGKWDNTGAVKVSEGTMLLMSTAVLGTGSLTVAKGATLMGVSGSTGTLTNSSYSINGTLHVGATASSVSGVMNFNGKNVTFSRGSTLVVGASKGAANGSTGGTSMGNIGKLTMNGCVAVYVPTSTSFVVGDSIVLWEAQSVTGTPTLDTWVIDEAAGLFWDDKDLAMGILRVTDIVPTAISSVTVHQEQKGAIYTSDGRRLPTSDVRLLQPGVYIQNGRKFYVK